MKKTSLIVVILILVIAGFVYSFIVKEEVTEVSVLVNCLAENNVVIYSSVTCSASIELVNSFGGYEAIKPIYVECSNQEERCVSEMKTNFVPEIQIDGEVYNGPRGPEILAGITGCEIDL